MNRACRFLRQEPEPKLLVYCKQRQYLDLLLLCVPACALRHVANPCLPASVPGFPQQYPWSDSFPALQQQNQPLNFTYQLFPWWTVSKVMWQAD